MRTVRVTAKIAKPEPVGSVPRGERRTSGAERTALTGAELPEFREMLLEKRRALLDDIDAMQDHGADDEAGLLESEWFLLREIDEALERIEDGTYGICLATGEPIAKARLRARPWAKYCLAYAQSLEKVTWKHV